jgi:hypothetical protein
VVTWIIISKGIREAYVVAGWDLQPDEKRQLDVVVERNPGHPPVAVRLCRTQTATHCSWREMDVRKKLPQRLRPPKSLNMSEESD